MSALDPVAVEEWAERLQCADLGIDYPFMWTDDDGTTFSAWAEQSHAEQERWRVRARLAFAAGLRPAPAPDSGGLYGKFRVERVEPSSRGIDHSACRYFVLDPQHDPHAVTAMRSYANAVRTSAPDLAADIDRWVGRDVHTHGPNEGRGTLCPERRDVLGLVGACQPERYATADPGSTR